MKNKRFIFILLVISHNVGTILSAPSIVERVGRIFKTWSFYRNLCNSSLEYDKKYGNIVRIYCSQCNERSLCVGGFFGALIGKIINDLIIGKDSFDSLQSLLNEGIRLMEEEQVDALHEFSFNHLKDIEYACPHCHAFAWVLRN